MRICSTGQVWASFGSRSRPEVRLAHRQRGHRPLRGRKLPQGALLAYGVRHRLGESSLPSSAQGFRACLMMTERCEESIWSFLILHKGEALREMWRKLRVVDLDSLGIEQVTNNGDRPYFRHQESSARLGIVAESEVDVLVQLGLTQGTGFVALRQVQYFKDPGGVALAFKSTSLLMITMSHRNKAHTAKSRKFLKEPTIQLANGAIDDRTFVWCAARWLLSGNKPVAQAGDEKDFGQKQI